MARLTALLLMGGPEFHNRPLHFAELAGIIAGEGGADLRISRDLDILTPAVLAQYHVLINWSTFLEPSDEQVSALLAAVEAGAGFVGLHAASATFWNSRDYLVMLGCRFIGHDRYKAFTVHIEDRTHPITAGIEDFAVSDELYQVCGGLAGFAALADATRQGRPMAEAVAAANAAGIERLGPDVQVLASAEGHPLLYAKTFGRGRVHYNALGHDQGALTNPSFRRLLIQGIRWAAGEI